MLKDKDCGSLRAADAGSRVSLAGWVDRRRDHGGLIFIDLRDRSGTVQVVINPESIESLYEDAERVRGEWVLRIDGEVSPRPPGTVNTNLATGEVEVAVHTLQVLNASLPPPFYINEDSDVDEVLRMRYRHLYLRRRRMQRNITLRYRIVKHIRDFLDERDFLEIETPILIKSTPEGARDYLVPSRVHPGSFYALPQSPQQLKQLLMVAGFERYFQIARCFRDEDLRADRQPEFTQLDLEMSFVEREDILELIEELYVTMAAKLVPEKRVQRPFPRISYADAMNRFGSDKPDLRFGLELRDVAETVLKSDFQVFRGALAEGGLVKGFAAPGLASIPRRQIDELTELARSRGARGLVTIALDGDWTDPADLQPEQVRSQVSRFFPVELMRDLAGTLGAVGGDLMLLVGGPKGRRLQRARRAAHRGRPPLRACKHGHAGLRLRPRLPPLRLGRGREAVGLRAPPLHLAQTGGRADAGHGPGSGHRAGVRPRVQRLRNGRRQHPHPYAGDAGNGPGPIWGFPRTP